MFYLTGFLDLETKDYWIFFPFFFMYLMAISGNCFILIIIKTDLCLHTPMNYLLSFLAFTDLRLSVSTLPTTMGIFWFNSHSIYFEGCQIQMFCIHSFSFMESPVLLAMSFDCFVVICHPLQYSVIITSPCVVRAGLVVILQGPMALVPLVFLLKAFPFSWFQVLSHSFCLHQKVIHLACTDTTFNNLYRLPVVVLTVIMDQVLIVCCPMGSSCTEWQSWLPQRSGSKTSQHVHHMSVLCWCFFYAHGGAFPHAPHWEACPTCCPHSYGQCLPLRASHA